MWRRPDQWFSKGAGHLPGDEGHHRGSGEGGLALKTYSTQQKNICIANRSEWAGFFLFFFTE